MAGPERADRLLPHFALLDLCSYSTHERYRSCGQSAIRFELWRSSLGRRMPHCSLCSVGFARGFFPAADPCSPAADTDCSHIVWNCDVNVHPRDGGRRRHCRCHSVAWQSHGDRLDIDWHRGDMYGLLVYRKPKSESGFIFVRIGRASNAGEPLFGYCRQGEHKLDTRVLLFRLPASIAYQGRAPSKPCRFCKTKGHLHATLRIRVPYHSHQIVTCTASPSLGGVGEASKQGSPCSQLIHRPPCNSIYSPIIL